MDARFERDIPTSSDALGEALYLLRLNGSLYCQSELNAPWSIAMPVMAGKMMFHIVMEGECWLSIDASDDDPPLSLQLRPGSLVLLPQGQGHVIASAVGAPGVNLFDIPVTQISERYELMRYGGEGERTLLSCGVISFDHIAGAKLLQQLPRVIHVAADTAQPNPWLQQTIQHMAAEAASLRAGGETIMAHLADIIVIQSIRHWIEHAPEAQHGWLGALQDPKLGKALAAIHAQPAQPWTVASLAQTAGMSRSGFSARFSELVGTSVKQYLTQWRMNLARAKLRSSPVSLGELAETLGYQSEAAFSRAYKRIMGESPVRGVS